MGRWFLTDEDADANRPQVCDRCDGTGEDHDGDTGPLRPRAPDAQASSPPVRVLAARVCRVCRAAPGTYHVPECSVGAAAAMALAGGSSLDYLGAQLNRHASRAAELAELRSRMRERAASWRELSAADVKSSAVDVLRAAADDLDELAGEGA